MSALKVQLTTADLEEAKLTAQFRYEMNLRAGREHRTYEKSMNVGFIGALGELATAKAFNIKWESARLNEEQYRQWNYVDKWPDVGPFEVRSTRYGSKLVIKSKDSSHFLMMLALVRNTPEWNEDFDDSAIVELAGWIRCDKGRGIAESFYNNIAVERTQLRSLDEELMLNIIAGCGKRSRSVIWPYEGRY